jgi:uncharacterized repeat protein (TIGR02543 family)
VLTGVNADSVGKFAVTNNSNEGEWYIKLVDAEGKLSFGTGFGLTAADGSKTYFDTLQDAVNAVPTGGSADSPATITLLNDEIALPSTIPVSGKHIRLVPASGGATIKRGQELTSGSLFTVASNASLTLGGGASGEELIIDGGAVWDDGLNRGITADRPLVDVYDGTLTITDGVTLKNNAALDGGGVSVNHDNGIFTMTGGSIENNNASNNGGGVYVGYGIFNMTGGVIQNNTSTSEFWGGGGVTVVYGEFQMSGTAEIKGNATEGRGRGVFLETSSATFTMTGGAVVAENNDVYLAGNTVITVADQLTASGIVAYITPASYVDDLPVLTGVNADSVGKFAVTNNSNGDEWYIELVGAEGKLDSRTGSGLTAYTVTFDADGGSPQTQTRTVNSGASVGSSNMPSGPTKSGYTFGGWYTLTGGSGTQFTATTTVSGDITVYAKWTVIQHTVTFNADGGSPATQTRTVNSGASVGSFNMPSEPGKSGYIFSGWYTLTGGGGTQFIATTIVTGNITVYAKWTVSTLQNAITTAPTGGSADSPFTITLTQGEITLPSMISVESGKHIRLVPANGGATIKRGQALTSGSLFEVASNASLTLGGGESGEELIIDGGKDENITATGALINVRGVLTMGEGVTLQNNHRTSGDGAGVYVQQGGTFDMTGGRISGNKLSSTGHGGGVFINGYNSGSTGTTTFTMTGEATIDANEASEGGGVAVYNAGAKFVMEGGYIQNNKATLYGGGVFMGYACEFSMTGGIIRKNESSKDGGGIYIFMTGTFTKTGGTVYGTKKSGGTDEDILYENTAVASGDALWKDHGTATNNGVSLSTTDNTF